MDDEIASELMLHADDNDNEIFEQGPFSKKQDSSDAEDTWAEFLEKSYYKAKDLAIGVLLLLSEQNGISIFSTKAGISLMTLQSITYVLTPLAQGDISSEDSIRLFLSSIVYYANLTHVLIAAISFRVLCYMVLAAVFLTFGLSIFVSYRKLSGANNAGTWSVKLLRRTATFMGGVAWMPMNDVFVTIVLAGDATTVGATSGVRILSAVLYFIFLTFVLVTVSTTYDPLLTSESAMACAHTRISVLERVVMWVWSTSSTCWSIYSLYDDTTLEMIRMLFLFASSFIFAYLFIYYQPFYKRTVNRWHAVSHMLIMWFSIGMLVRSLKSYILNIDLTYSDFDAAVLIVFGVPLIPPLTHFLMHNRIRKLCQTDTFRIRNAFELELKMRTYLFDNHPTLRDDPEKFQAHKDSLISNELDINDAVTIYEDSGLAQLWTGSQNNTSKSQNKQNPFNNQDREERLVLKHVRNVYEAAIAQYSSSAMVCIFQIHFYLCFYPNERGTILSRMPLIKARNRKPYFDLDFRLFKLSARLQENVSTGRDVVSFVASEKCEREARLFDRMSCIQLLEFWKEFQSKTPDLRRVQELSKRVFEYFSKAQNSYLRLIKLQPKSARHLNMYGSFLNDILNDKAGGSKVLYRADALEEERQKGPVRHGRSIDNIGERLDPVLIFEINDYGSEERTNFGEISYANNDAAYLLNSVTHKLVGRNIKEFLLPPFSSHMHLIVAHFFKEGWSPFFGRAVRTFMITSQQHLLEVSMRLAPYTNDGVKFTIFMSLNPLENITESAAQDERWFGYMIVNATHDQGRILGGNLACSQLLQRFTHLRETDANLLGTSLVADDIIEDFSQLRSELIAAGDSWTEIDLTKIKESWENRITSITCQLKIYEYEGMQLDRVSIAVTLQRQPRKTTFVTYQNSSDNFGLSRDFDEGVESPDGMQADVQSPSSQGYAMGARGRFPSRALSSYASTVPDKRNSKMSVMGANRYGSGKSASSAGTDEGAATAYLRKMLHEEMGRQHMSPMLQSLSTKYLATVCFVILLAVIYFVIQEKRLQQYADEVDFLNRAGFRRFTSVSLAYCVHCMYLINIGHALPAGITETYLRSELATQATTLKTIDLESFGQRSKDTSLWLSYTSDNTELLEYILGEPQTSFQSLFEATSYLTSIAHQLSEAPLSDFTLDNPKVYLMLNQINGDTAYLQDLNRTTFEYTTLAESRITSMVPVFLVALSFALFLQVTLLIIFIAPLVLMIERNKVEVLHVLRSIPPYSIGTISSKCKTRLQDVHDVSHEALAAQFGKQGPSESRSKNKKKSKSSSARRARIARKALMTVLLQRFTCCRRLSNRFSEWRKKGNSVVPMPAIGAERGNNNGSMKMPKYGMDYSQVSMPWKLLLKLSLPGNLALIFYGLNFEVGFFHQISYLLHIPYSVNLGGLRRATLRLFKHTLLMYFAGTSFSQEPRFAVNLTNVTHVMSMFTDVNDALFNGRDQYGGLIEYAASEPGQVTLILENGCYNWRQLTGKPTESDCEAYMQGVMEGGLSAASFQFIEGLKALLGAFEETNKTEVDIFFNTTEMNELLTLEEDYLQNQFTTSVLLYITGITNSLENGKTKRNVILALFLILISILYIFVVRDVLRTLDQTLRRTRRLLLMVPEELFGRLPILRDFVQREFKKNRI